MIPCTRYVTSEASRCDAGMGVCGTEPTIEIVGWWLRCPVGTGSFLFLRVAEDCDAGEVKQRDDAYAGADENKGIENPFSLLAEGAFGDAEFGEDAEVVVEFVGADAAID